MFLIEIRNNLPVYINNSERRLVKHNISPFQVVQQPRRNQALAALSSSSGTGGCRGWSCVAGLERLLLLLVVCHECCTKKSGGLRIRREHPYGSEELASAADSLRTTYGRATFSDESRDVLHLLLKVIAGHRNVNSTNVGKYHQLQTEVIK